MISQSPEVVVVRNYEGAVYSYPQPSGYVCKCTCNICSGKKKNPLTGVAGRLAEKNPQSGRLSRNE
jgi:lysine 2,3-aminomutase